MDGTLTGAPVSVVGLCCRTSDAIPESARGARELAELAGERLGVEPRIVGEPGRPRKGRFEDDLRDSHGCLLEAGGQVQDALSAGRVPLLFAGDCSLAVSTLPTIARMRPDARVLWLDAHGDFNTPETTRSAFLGGMCLAGGCGLWDTGFEGALPPERLVLAGVRDLDAEERRLLEQSDATVIGASLETLVYTQNALDRAAVYMHLDLDILDPEEMPARYPAAGGLAPDKLYDLLEAVTGECELVGAEVTCFDAPGDERLAAIALRVIEPILDAVRGAHVGN
jgi:arginase